MLLKTHLAQEQFAQGHYANALALYQQLSRVLGQEAFEASIQLCRQRATSKAVLAVESPDYQSILKHASNVPTSNGSRHHQPIPLDVAIVTDVPMYNYYKDVFRSLVYLTPDDYEQQIEHTKIDLFLYVSHWRGSYGTEWARTFADQSKWNALKGIIETCRQKNISTLFQSIEDPSNYDRFLPVAQLCDIVFTTDTDSIQNYIRDCGHQRVYHGGYGVNPRLHNPIGTCRTLWDAFFFAGSWITKYAERCDDMEVIFDSVLKTGSELTIIDRRYQQKLKAYAFPTRFQSRTLPPMDHTLLQSAHKLFAHSVNLNSIKHSPTMGAMRVYELQAMGLPIYSNYALSTCLEFPEIRLLPCPQDLSLEQLKWSRLEFRRSRMSQIRHVMNDKTAHDVVAGILQKARICLPREPAATVCVICTGADDNVTANFERQRYPHRILVQQSDIASAEAWRELVARHGIRYFGWMTADDEYEENYLGDLVNGFKYTRASYVTKRAWFMDGILLDHVQHDYTDEAGGKARTLFAAADWAPDRFVQLHPHESIPDLPGGYAIDPFELNYLRYCERRWRGKEQPKPALTVLLPIMDNARLAQARCLASLLRNRRWPTLEVLLLADESADTYTHNILTGLARIHANARFVPVHCLPESDLLPQLLDAGPGLARAPVLAVLHPGDEVCPGGLDHLLDAWEEAGKSSDGAALEILAGRVATIGQHNQNVGIESPEPLQIVDQPREDLLATGIFPVIASQALLVSRQLLLRHPRHWPAHFEGGGTAWAWQLLCHAQRAAFSNTVCSIQYVGPQEHEEAADPHLWFQRQLAKAQEQVDLLQREGLFGTYLQSQHARLTLDELASRLDALSRGPEHGACAALARQVQELYGVPPGAPGHTQPANSASDGPATT